MLCCGVILRLVKPLCGILFCSLMQPISQIDVDSSLPCESLFTFRSRLGLHWICMLPSWCLGPLKFHFWLNMVQKLRFNDTNYLEIQGSYCLLNMLLGWQSILLNIDSFYEKYYIALCFNCLTLFILYALCKWLLMRIIVLTLVFIAINTVFSSSASTKDAVWNLSCLFISTSNNSVICGLYPPT